MGSSTTQTGSSSHARSMHENSKDCMSLQGIYLVVNNQQPVANDV
jgi:hypothetical protein